jgi:hypothetical protein
MTDLSQKDAAMLRKIAGPDISGVPGALGSADIGVLLGIGLVTFGFAPVNDGTPPTYANAWVRPTEAGLAWLAAHPTPAAT